MHNTIQTSWSSQRRQYGRPLAHPKSTLIRGAALLAGLDSLAALAAIVGVLISLNLSHMLDGIDSFLSIRITREERVAARHSGHGVAGAVSPVRPLRRPSHSAISARNSDGWPPPSQPEPASRAFSR